MPRNYTILGQRNPSANVLTTLYQVPDGNSAVISSINIANLDANAAAFSIAANVNGVATANANYLAWRVSVPGNDSIALSLGVTLNASSFLSVNANTSTVSFSAFGTEMY
jgi:hypothetical protein